MLRALNKMQDLDELRMSSGAVLFNAFAAAPALVLKGAAGCWAKIVDFAAEVDAESDASLGAAVLSHRWDQPLRICAVRLKVP